nr:restriction endonuclease subunit S [uncultured Sphingobacterium sp.]
MWEKVKLKDITNTSSGGTPSRTKSEYFKDGDIPWILSGDLNKNEIIESKNYITDLGLKNSSAKIFPKNSILIAMYGATIGNASILRIEAATNQAICCIFPNPKYNSKFLYYYFKKAQNELIKLGMGNAQPNISQSIINEIKIPLPPLPIQKKIADILDKADKLRRKDKDLQTKYDELAQAIFIDMFGDPVRNEKGWKVKPFSYFVTFDTIMTSDFEKYAEVPHIGVGNIERDSGRLINYKPVKDENIKSGKYIFTSNHIIYSKIRPNLNKVALPTFGGLCSADSYPLLPTQNSNKYFFSHLLRSEHFLDFISSFSNRANIPKVNKEQLKKYFGIAPSIALQEEFAKKIEIINQLKKQTNTEKSEELFQSLLQKAFKGELVS